MAAKLVPTIRTSYNSTEMIRGFVEGWKAAFNQIPTKKQIAVLWAQNQLETGGTVSMWNNNIGNVKFVPSSNTNNDTGKEYCMLANTWEIVNGKKVTFQPPHPATWFRSFHTLGEGISHHMSFLQNKRYKIAWQAVVEGDPTKFSKLLRQQGYYTAPEEQYTKAVLGYYNIFMKSKTFDSVIASLTPPPKPVPEPEEVVTEPVIDVESVKPEPVAPIDPTDNGPKQTSLWEQLMAFLAGLFNKK